MRAILAFGQDKQVGGNPLPFTLGYLNQAPFTECYEEISERVALTAS
jgi:hypothetical protein